MSIAVCDDRKDERHMITEALKTVIKDFSADEFDDGNELLKSHDLRRYDLIILDIIMPKISGMDTAAALRKTDVETPVFFVISSTAVFASIYGISRCHTSRFCYSCNISMANLIGVVADIFIIAVFALIYRIYESCAKSE